MRYFTLKASSPESLLERWGWWIGLSAAVPAATLFAGIFDAAGMKVLTAPAEGDVTLGAVQIGLPLVMQREVWRRRESGVGDPPPPSAERELEARPWVRMRLR